MLHLAQSPKFRKSFSSLPEKLKRKTLERLAILIDNEFDQILNNHPLHGEYSGCRSINITGDLRIVYEKIDNNICHLLFIGTHSQLYE